MVCLCLQKQRWGGKTAGEARDALWGKCRKDSSNKHSRDTYSSTHGVSMDSLWAVVLDGQRGEGCEDTLCRPLMSQYCPRATVSRSPPFQHWQVMTPPPHPHSGGSCTLEPICVLTIRAHRAMPLFKDLLWLSSTAPLSHNGIFWLPPGGYAECLVNHRRLYSMALVLGS